MRKFLKLLAWTVLLLVVLFDIGLLLGMRLPREHTVVRTMMLGAPRQAVWQAITDFSKQPEWRANLKSVERLPDRDGLPVWRESYKRMGSETLVTEQFIPPTLNHDIADSECDLDYVPNRGRSARVNRLAITTRAIGPTYSVVVLGSPPDP